jgi:hypothetical protein
MRTAVSQLESRGLIEYLRADSYHQRKQGAWRITARGRALLDGLDLPPAA